MADPKLQNPLDTMAPSLAGGAPLFMAFEDAIKISVANGLAGVTATVTGRFLPLGQAHAVPFRFDLVPTTDRAATTKIFDPGEGWLLECSVVVSAGAPQIGQAFAVLSIVRGLGSAALELSTLASGDITTTARVAYPAGGVRSPLDGGGAIRSITGAVPAAGAEISEAVPANARWEVLAFAATLVTAVAVANRRPLLRVDDGANEFVASPMGVDQVASTTFTYDWFPGAPVSTVAVSLRFTAPLPTGLAIGPAFRLRTLTSGIQGADQWSAPQYLVRERISGL